MLFLCFLSSVFGLQIEEFVEVKAGEPVTLGCNFDGKSVVMSVILPCDFRENLRIVMIELGKLP